MRGLPLAPVVFSLLSFVVLQGCAPRPPSDPFQSSPDRSLVLRVVNRGYDDVHVFLVRGSSPIPVGHVASGEQRSFRLAPSIAPSASAFRLMARPFGGRATFTSEPLAAYDGAQLEWTLAHDLKYSTVSIR